MGDEAELIAHVSAFTAESQRELKINCICNQNLLPYGSIGASDKISPAPVVESKDTWAKNILVGVVT